MDGRREAIEAALAPVREAFNVLDGDLTLDEVRGAIRKLHTATEQAGDDLREIKLADLPTRTGRRPAVVSALSFPFTGRDRR